MKTTKVIFWTCLLISIIMLITSFLVPPTGIIDGSVLTGVGELFGFATLGTVPSLVKGRNVELKHGNTSLNISDEDVLDTTKNDQDE